MSLIQFFYFYFQGQIFKAQPRIGGCPVLSGDLKTACHIFAVDAFLLALSGNDLHHYWDRGPAPHGSCQKMVNYYKLWSKVLPQVQRPKAFIEV